VCDIFGAAGLSGRAVFLDAHPKSTIVPIKRTHVAIRRDTNAQSDGSLMELEAVDKGAVFLGKIRLINAENWQIGAILVALEVLKLVGLGAKKTAGYGEIDTSTKKITLNTFVGGAQETEDKTSKTEEYRSAFEAKLSKNES
jgi:CRISPR/Cas system CSM-associated protein Csm3 (group 7 of RAMP superfamily)